MRKIAYRLEALQNSKARTACTDDRLYSIDGKICELEDLLKPRRYQQEWMEELKERQAVLDSIQEKRKAWEEEEGRQLLEMIGKLNRPRMQQILRLLYIEGLGITAAAAIMYADQIKRTGKPASKYTSTMHRRRLAALARLEELQEQQTQTTAPGERDL